MTNIDPLDIAAGHVKAGHSLRAALRAAGLPQTSRMQLARRLNDLGVDYRWQGKGQRDDTARLKALETLGNPCYGAHVGYWKRLASLVSELEGKTVTPETIQLWYGRRFGPAYVRKWRKS